MKLAHTTNSYEEGRMRNALSILLMGGLFVLIYGLALLLVGPFEAAGVAAFQNPNDPFDLVFLFVMLLVFTLVILLISKFWKKQIIQGIILGSTGYIAFFVLYPLLSTLISDIWAITFSLISAAILVLLLIRYPEWYIVDICGILVGLGAIVILGISLSIFLVIVFLTGMTIYDALSVYKTKHMIDLADVVLDLKLPVMLVIPKTRDYSMIKDTKTLKQKLKDQEEREAFYMGLGDIVMPGILVASAFYNTASNGLIIALSVVLGTLLGFTVLVAFLLRGKPQAGLPFLCSGAILGYLISSYLTLGFISLFFLA
jgi:presenilin-like A22 family membrane protease